MDIFGNGYLQCVDLKSAFKTFNMEVDEKDMAAIIEVFDPSGDGRITFDEFRKVFFQWPCYILLPVYTFFINEPIARIIISLITSVHT